MGADIINTSLTKQFLSLVRAALWQKPPDRQPFDDSPADWDAIGRLSVDQTVGPLAMTGAMDLPQELLPPREWLNKAHAFIERNRRTHVLLDSCVAEAAGGLKAAGIESVLLKGQAYARHYPDVALRQCGDIDLYVGEDNYFAAYKTSRQLGWGGDEIFNPEAKHYGCMLKGVRIELHRAAAELDGRRINRRFQGWSRLQLHDLSSRLMISGREINVPAPIFDVVYVFLHMYRHFLASGVGLRQLCDWVMLLHAHAKNIRLSELETVLREFGLLRAWRRFAPIAVELLGLPEEECPFYSTAYGGASDKILSFILTEGNFGRCVPPGSLRPKGYLAGKIHSFRHQSARLMSRFSLDPITVIRCHSRVFSRGIKVMIDDMMKKAEL